MRCLTPFLMLAVVGLIALSAYNTWQIRELRAELVGVRARAEKPAGQDGAEKELNRLVEDARKQTERAKDLVARGQFERARQELNKSLQKLDKASEMSKDIADSAVRGVNGAVSDIKNAIDGISKGEGKRMEGNETNTRK